jgi:hypothetical protein
MSLKPIKTVVKETEFGGPIRQGEFVTVTCHRPPLPRQHGQFVTPVGQYCRRTPVDPNTGG